MQQQPTLSGLQMVPEDIIEFCASQFAPNEENSFRNILNTVDEFRDAGLTPIILCTTTLKELYVTTKEKLQKKLH